MCGNSCTLSSRCNRMLQMAETEIVRIVRRAVSFAIEERSKMIRSLRSDIPQRRREYEIYDAILYGREIKYMIKWTRFISFRADHTIETGILETRIDNCGETYWERRVQEIQVSFLIRKLGGGRFFSQARSGIISFFFRYPLGYMIALNEVIQRGRQGNFGERGAASLSMLALLNLEIRTRDRAVPDVILDGDSFCGVLYAPGARRIARASSLLPTSRQTGRPGIAFCLHTFLLTHMPVCCVSRAIHFEKKDILDKCSHW